MFGHLRIVYILTSYLVDVLMSYRKGEGETQGKFLVLDVVFVQKVRHAFCDVVEQLQRKTENERIRDVK